MSNFQTQVNQQPAPAVAGDFASANPRSVVLAGPGNLIAGALTPPGASISGVVVGRFCWTSPGSAINPSSGVIDGSVAANNTGAGAPAGFLGREEQALITKFLAASSLLVPTGLPITLYTEGDFWAVNSGASASAIGNTIYALNASGLAAPGAANTPPTDASAITMTVVANQINVSAVVANAGTASIAGTVMTVSAQTAGSVFYTGMTVTGTNVAAGTVVTGQLTGTAGSTGTYSVNIAQTVASTAITGSGSGLTVTSMTNGKVLVGMVLSGGTNPVAAGTTVLAGGTGVGGAGTYPLSINQTCASIATATGNGAYANITALTGAINVNDSFTSTASGSVSTILSQISGTPTGIGAYWLSNASAIGDTAGTVASGTATKWTAQSVAAPGELMKISTWARG